MGSPERSATSRHDGKNDGDKKSLTCCFFRISIGGEAIAEPIVIELDVPNRPKTCQSFLSLCKNNIKTTRTDPHPTYRGCEFHRVVPGLCVQTGDWDRFDGTGGASPLFGKHWPDEFNGSSSHGNNNRHDREGVVSMANAGKPNTNGSQFFITLKAAPHLDRNHTVFGRVVSGMDTVHKMVDVERGPKDRPVSLQRIVIQGCGLVGNNTDDRERPSSKSKKDKQKKRSKKHKREKKKRHRKIRGRHESSGSDSDNDYSADESESDEEWNHSEKHRRKDKHRRKKHSRRDDTDESSVTTNDSYSSKDRKRQKRRRRRVERRRSSKKQRKHLKNYRRRYSSSDSSSG